MAITGKSAVERRREGVEATLRFRRFPAWKDPWIAVPTQIGRGAGRARDEAGRQCSRHSQIDTLDVESLPAGVSGDCVLRWTLAGRERDPVAEGSRLIGLQL